MSVWTIATTLKSKPYTYWWWNRTYYLPHKLKKVSKSWVCLQLRHSNHEHLTFNLWLVEKYQRRILQSVSRHVHTTVELKLCVRVSVWIIVCLSNGEVFSMLVSFHKCVQSISEWHIIYGFLDFRIRKTGWLRSIPDSWRNILIILLSSY